MANLNKWNFKISFANFPSFRMQILNIFTCFPKRATIVFLVCGGGGTGKLLPETQDNSGTYELFKAFYHHFHL